MTIILLLYFFSSWLSLLGLLWFAICKLLKHDLKLFKVNLAIPVDINFGDYVLPDLLLLTDVVTEDGCDFLRLDRATSVFVEQFEGSKHVRLAQEFNLVDCSRAPLAEIDLSTSINVSLIENFICAFIYFYSVELGVQGTVGFEELISLDQTVAILIKLVEGIAQFLLLLLGCKMTGHERQGRLLEF